MEEIEECEHELVCCPHCNVVYCLKCGEEWTNEDDEIIDLAPFTPGVFVTYLS